MKLRLSQENTSPGEAENSSTTSSSIPELELIRDYRRVQLAIGRPPSISDIQEHGKYSPSTYTRKYGSWSKFRELVSNPVKTEKLSIDELIENYYTVKEMLGRTPNGKELAKYGQYGGRTYHKYFGGHRKLLEYLGET